MSSLNLSEASLEELYSSLKEITGGDEVQLFEDKITTFKDNSENASIEEINDNVRQRFLKPSNVLSWDLLDLIQTVPKHDALDYTSKKTNEKYNYYDFVQVPQPISKTSYVFKRKGISGNIVSHKEEVSLKEIAKANASNSLSLTRSIDYHNNNIRGSTAQLPFTPGGITMKSDTVSDSRSSATATATKLLHKDEQGLFDIPPGFTKGIQPKMDETSVNGEEVEDIKQLNEIDNEMEVEREINENNTGSENDVQSQLTSIISQKSENAHDNKDNAEIDELLPMDVNFGRSVTKSKDLLKRKEWAHVVDLNHKIENFDELVPNPARTWPFELDTFQKEAVYHLEQGDSVFVAAHTSAGKTVVAEYAIAMAKRNMTKTIYTSPIKALSNQKFRDFKETFEDIDVGLITGDVQINPEANCLIMTTEILRSMLYRGADLIRDVEFVVFDEVHYVNDQDRGVVWEEVIIMLPQHVKFILLSATVPNTYEFANWIGRTKQKNIYVISTPQRPVPLEINIWAKGKLLPVITPSREFVESNFKEHKLLLSGDDSKAPSKNGDSKGGQRGGRGGQRGGRGGQRGGRGGQQGGQRGGRGGSGSRGAGAVGSNKRQFFRRAGPNKKTWPQLVDYLRSKDLLPMVAFVFSKKRCEEYADWLDGVNFSNNKDKSQIHMFVEKSITRLKKDDRELPQILKMRSLLERGIAVHHGGLLPIVKELIEILFAKGFIKVLFATETFAMGLNLPTRTVVFSEIQKHDGNGLRDLTPGEFTQMAGRAGRRGLDKTGTVIIMAYEPFSALSFKEITLGVPTKLESQFRLTYNMILNLLRIEALKVEEMIKYSFSENTNQTSKPEHEKIIKELQGQLESVKEYECDCCAVDLSKFLDTTNKYKEKTTLMMEEISKSNSVHRILREGRLIVFRDQNNDLRLGFIVRNSINQGVAVVMVFTEPNKLTDGETNNLVYLPDFTEYTKTAFGCFQEVPYFMDKVPYTSIELITAYNLKVPFASIIKQEPEVVEKFKFEMKIILKLSDRLKETSYGMKGSLKAHQYIQERENIRQEILSLKSSTCSKLPLHFIPKYKKYQIEEKINHLQHLMSDENLNLLPNYEHRLNVLQSAGFIDVNHNVQLKGRVACEINSGYELVLTELILDNFLGDFEPEEIVALLSVFVYEGRTREEEPPIVTPRLVKGKQRIQEIYKNMLAIYEENQVTLTQEEAEFLEKKRFAMVNVVYEWARGMSFKEIMEISPEAEGTVVRVITWLDEICREVKTASIIIGNSNLHMKMDKAQELIKRDIVFAASLYL
ncbi:similar to Saccharomyces cerevisiae YLR398C SKI2 Ski complex component and putative RNA helicase, mediates 3'-5' RNA degradation by the cytoplasmic exosome [Maudiozyma saulgeensis]|uniref:Similar to Saccharomyces cerevisiae YLR398C SKI2 Ski complex component and putative RNA helicase, mediates 3'-5' RNA degradation by the cytoplasmic exosome n=1 Tax=Maudiozyma saulgeensis TaxID=1789683 RepID=A0A1X7RAJ3_9SACH|nr:similar to Saccharomyces cerevisiae YLR398C SKI2 Ski complex component and putative RNA helicase, mediates 3'-5' RNA degradation by the cytoplasmic exosome [Kazachstania saulgeensis]